MKGVDFWTSIAEVSITEPCRTHPEELPLAQRKNSQKRQQNARKGHQSSCIVYKNNL
jgi:hypothetical protein